MSEPYILVSDQEEDWKPVIKNFVSECALQELVEIKKEPQFLCNETTIDGQGNWIVRPKYGAPITKIVLGQAARKLGHTDIKTLFNHWFNKVGHFAPRPYQDPYGDPYYDPAGDIY